MDVYIYNGDIYGEVAGEEIIAQLTEEGKAPADIDDESSYDSADFPKGPYADGGGEADTPQHCGRYGTFLENPLTQAGYAYVREQVGYKLDWQAEITPDDDDSTLALRLAAKLREAGADVLAQWADYYPEAFDKANGGPLPYVDGEITGYDAANGYIIQWGDDVDAGRPGFYCSQETPEQYGLEGLEAHELDRLKAAGWTPA